ncbi:MAG: GTPase HflX [Candidatus Gracilibacteria bacterium]|jgi:GTP-binding protein HflX
MTEPTMPKEKPKAILVDIIPLHLSKFEAFKRLEELESLVSTYGGIVVVKAVQKRDMPDYQTYIGKGKVQEILAEAKEKGVSYVILNNIAKTKQLFNLNEIFNKDKIQVWDRIDIILNIFEKHAQSTEAILQIELARIRHMGPRIMGMGKDLMRQEGRIGIRSGQGESNIELMKRHLRTQELKILEKLKHYDTINEGHRKRRKRDNFKTAALVGYTNAGKSSLMKALTNKDVYIADELFATLETKVGKIYIQNIQKEVLISDTIGFIQDLPPDLISAFKSTLGETIDADIILHVIDISDPLMEMKIKVVEEILKQLGVDKKPKIYVFNKIDLIEEFKKIDENGENKEEIFRPIGLLKAGEETAKLLGWEKHDDQLEALKNNYPEIDMLELKAKYKQYSPVFVSAVKKQNLNDLIKTLTSKILYE